MHTKYYCSCYCSPPIIRISLYNGSKYEESGKSRTRPPYNRVCTALVDGNTQSQYKRGHHNSRRAPLVVMGRVHGPRIDDTPH